MTRVNRKGCALLWVLAFCTASTLTHAAGARGALRAGPYLQALGARSVEIHVEIDPPSALDISVRRDAWSKQLKSNTGSLHTVSVDGLEPRARYVYTVDAPGVHAEGSFVTAPPDESKEPFTVLAYGDNRTDDQAHAAIVAAMQKTPSDFLVHTGDLLGDPRRQEEWARFFSIERPLLVDRCVFTAVGNHDLLDDANTYKKYFSKLNSSVRWEFARFWFVNAMDESPEEWLTKDLAAHDAEDVKWRIVVLHQGPYASGPHGPNELIHQSTVSNWLGHKVDLVISGHDHIYERGIANGLRYLVTGGGGAPVYPIDKKIPTTRKAESVRHFVELRFEPEAVYVVGHRLDGTVIEDRRFTKTLGWDDDSTVPTLVPPKEGTPVPPPSERSNVGWIAAAVVLVVAVLLFFAGRRRKQE